MLDVAIVGAGPIGLATAAALFPNLGSDASIQVFDHVPSLVTCGAGLALAANGQAALKGISPELLALVHKAGKLSPQEGSFTKQGTNGVQSVKLSNDDSKADAVAVSSPLLIGWSDLRNALAQWLPEGTLQLSKRFASLTQHSDHVVIGFADSTQVFTRVVVGADGCFSQVRQCTLNDGPPDNTGTVVWRARLPLEQLPGGGNKPHMSMQDTCLGLVYPISDDHCVWTVAAPVKRLVEADVPPKPAKVGAGNATQNGRPCSAEELLQQRTKAGQVVIERCKKVWGQAPGEITAAIDATDPATALEHTLFVRHPSSLDGGHWGVGRVTLAGDAAHPMRPTGQGVNQGLEDAYDLGRFLAKDGLEPETLRAFEAERIPRVQQIMAAEMINGMKAYTITAETEHAASSLAKYKWAKTLWESRDHPQFGDILRQYNAWAMSRHFH